MKLPVSTATLFDYIPHRPPMVWVDEVTTVTIDGGSTRILLKDALYMGPRGLRLACGIEFLAQSFGYIGVARYLLAGASGEGRIEKAFLVAIRDAQVKLEEGDPRLGVGAELIVRLLGKKEVGPVQITDGEITTADGAIVMTANLKVYSEISGTSQSHARPSSDKA